MNIEDRAQLMLEEIPNQKPWEGKEELKAKFIKHLRDQIEDCAKIADGMQKRVMATSKEYEGKDDTESALRMYAGAKAAEIAAREIRALAGSTTTEERKESER